MIVTKPDGTKVKQVTWQKPEVWSHQGYKCHMYQSSNQWLNWRCLKIVRPDGSVVPEAQVSYGYKSNISPSRSEAQEYLKQQIAWDLTPEAERQAHLESVRQQEQYLF